MSAMTAKRQEIVGKDQDGRDVYADKSVVVPGSLRPDGTRRKDLRVRAEQRPDGSWRSFVPQDEVKKYEVRARRPANPPGAAAGPPLPPPLFKREAPAGSRSARRAAARRRRNARPRRSRPWPRRRSGRDGGARRTAEGRGAPATAATPATAAAARQGLTARKLKAASDLQARVAAGLSPMTQQAENHARRGELEKTRGGDGGAEHRAAHRANTRPRGITTKGGTNSASLHVQLPRRRPRSERTRNASPTARKASDSPLVLSGCVARAFFR